MDFRLFSIKQYFHSHVFFFSPLDDYSNFLGSNDCVFCYDLIFCIDLILVRSSSNLQFFLVSMEVLVISYTHWHHPCFLCMSPQHLCGGTKYPISSLQWLLANRVPI